MNEITGKNPFKVPENYFEEVNRKIISATAGIKPETRKTGLFYRLRPVLAIAASVAALILLTYAAAKIFLPVNNESRLPEISMEEFSISYPDDIDMLLLEENEYSLGLFDQVPEISNSEIVDYLLFENIDLNEIYEIL